MMPLASPASAAASSSHLPSASALCRRRWGAIRDLFDCGRRPIRPSHRCRRRPFPLRVLDESKGTELSVDTKTEISESDKLVDSLDFGELCNDFECVSSPYVEATARQLVRDILELREGNRALGSFAVSVKYKVLEELAVLTFLHMDVKFIVVRKVPASFARIKIMGRPVKTCVEMVKIDLGMGREEDLTLLIGTSGRAILRVLDHVATTISRQLFICFLNLPPLSW